MVDGPLRVSVGRAAAGFGELVGGLTEALVGAVRDITGASDLTLLEIQVRVVEPALAGASLHADVECLRRGDNVVFARAAVTDDRGRLVATATATLMRAS